MPLLLFSARRRTNVTREAFANAALDFCRATRNVDGAKTHFYWTGTDTIGFLVSAGGFASLNRISGQSDDTLVPEMERARFVLADIAEILPAEVWREPRLGQATYYAAGR